jgi:micrococcal nuclease
MQRRFRTRRGYRFWLALLVALVLLVRAAWEARHTAPVLPPSEGTFSVRYVIDGDTLQADDLRVRLIGIDAPERRRPDHPGEPWAEEATEFVKDRIEAAGGQVRLEFDREPFDQYKRHLAYVYAGDKLLNEELIRAGLARHRAEFRYSEVMKRRFRKAQQEAQENLRGIWSAGGAASRKR